MFMRRFLYKFNFISLLQKIFILVIIIFFLVQFAMFHITSHHSSIIAVNTSADSEIKIPSLVLI